MAPIVRQCDYIGDGMYLHLTVTGLTASVEVKVILKNRAEENYRLVATIRLWNYKSMFLATGSTDPVLLHRACQMLLDDNFATHFPQASNAFSAWQRSIPPT